MRTFLLFITVFLLMSSVGVYATNVADTGPIPAESPTREPISIGVELNGTEVKAITVTWIPAAIGDYKIEAMSGKLYGVLLLPVTSMDERTDIILIDSIDVNDLEPIEVAITEL